MLGRAGVWGRGCSLKVTAGDHGNHIQMKRSGSSKEKRCVASETIRVLADG